MNFHHVGIAVNDIDEVRTSLEALFARPVTGKVYDGGQCATLQMLDLCGLPVELVEGKAVEKMLFDWECKFRAYHTCFEVDSILESIDDFRKAGYLQVNNILPAPLFSNRLVVFMVKDEVVIELLEKELKKEVKI